LIKAGTVSFLRLAPDRVKMVLQKQQPLPEVKQNSDDTRKVVAPV
jgi:hypothetical protein